MTEPAVRDTGGETLKVDIILGAYSQLRISGITRDPSPEDLETALCRLENMAAEWDSRTISVGYNFEDEPDPNSNAGIIRGFRHAFETNLAARLIPDFNKQVPGYLLGQANQSLSNLSSRAAADRLRGVQYPSRQPTGSGNESAWRWSRFFHKHEQAPQSSSTLSLYIGDVMDLREHFGSLLRDTEDLSSYTVTAESGVRVVSDSLSSPDVVYRVEAEGSSGSTSAVSEVTVVATTDTGRVFTKKRYFEVIPRS